jgi:hypothetical protein
MGRDTNGHDCSKRHDPENIPAGGQAAQFASRRAGYIIGFAFAKLATPYPMDVVRPTGEHRDDCDNPAGAFRIPSNICNSVELYFGNSEIYPACGAQASSGGGDWD